MQMQDSRTCQHVWSPFRLNFGHHCDHHDAKSWNVVCKRKCVASRISNAIRTCTQGVTSPSERAYMLRPMFGSEISLIWHAGISDFMFGPGGGRTRRKRLPGPSWNRHKVFQRPSRAAWEATIAAWEAARAAWEAAWEAVKAAWESAKAAWEAGQSALGGGQGGLGGGQWAAWNIRPKSSKSPKSAKRLPNTPKPRAEI